MATAPAAGPSHTPARDHMSWTALRTYQACPLRYAFKYVHRLPETTVAASLLVGVGVHAALESHYRALVAGQSASLETLLAAFWGAWQARRTPTILFSKGEDPGTVDTLVRRLLRAFQHSALARPRGKIVAIEEQLRGQILNGLPDLVARLDLVVDDGDALTLTDFKTSRAAWTADQVWQAADQLLLYSALVKSWAPWARGRPLRLQFAVLTKTRIPSLTVHPVPCRQPQIERSRRPAESVCRAIDGGHFYPNPSPWQCPACPFRQACSQWQG